MVNYSLGKIYKIEPISGGEEGDVYVGSTSLPLLSTRMAHHRADFKRFKKDGKKYISSSILLEKYGVENCHIILLENVNAANKDELTAREGHWIKTTSCVNKKITGRTRREWMEDNKERVKIIQQQYEVNNREHKRQYIKQYRLNNKERISQQQKEYRLNNKSTNTIVCQELK